MKEFLEAEDIEIITIHRRALLGSQKPSETRANMQA